MGFVVMVYVQDADELGTVDPGTGRTVGIYSLPTAKETPTCPGTCSKTEKKLNGWGRDPKGGFIVHACGRRHRDWRRRLSTTLLDVLGINTLRRAETPLMFQNPQGWGR